jgi:hypothetical protein
MVQDKVKRISITRKNAREKKGEEKEENES